MTKLWILNHALGDDLLVDVAGFVAGFCFPSLVLGSVISRLQDDVVQVLLAGYDIIQFLLQSLSNVVLGVQALKLLGKALLFGKELIHLSLPSIRPTNPFGFLGCFGCHSCDVCFLFECLHTSGQCLLLRFAC